jgi:L-fuconolactonase
MQIIDSQVHILGPDGPDRPWAADFTATLGSGPLAEATRKHFEKSVISGDQMLAAMDAAGVHGAVLVATSHYGWDNGYSLDAAKQAPSRFRVVGRVDPHAADLDSQVAAWAAEPLAVGLRLLVLTDTHREQLLGGHFDAFLDACRRHDVSVSVYPAGHLDALGSVIRRFDGVRWVIDHLGLSQPPVLTPDPDRFERLPQLAALAEVANVSVKLSGMPTLSTEAYPYADLMAPLGLLIEAFGVERLLWGTDWTRTKSLLGYRENVTFLDDLGVLSGAERQAIYEDNARRLFAWPA